MHGTRYEYRFKDCRCVECRAWEAARKRGQRKRRRQLEAELQQTVKPRTEWKTVKDGRIIVAENPENPAE